MTERIDAPALYAQVQAAIRRALTDVFAEFRAGADRAYAGTRWAGTFAVQPTPILRSASLVTSAPLLQVVEYPTRPHPIVARNGPVLVFWWAHANRLFVGPAVAHPGTRGRRALDPLHTAAAAQLGTLLYRYLDGLNR